LPTDTHDQSVIYADTFPVLLLSQKDLERVQATSVFDEILQWTVAIPSKTWLQAVGGFCKGTIDHGRWVDSPEALAKRLAGAIVNAIDPQHD